jgi:hypothetical protein
MKLWQRIKNYDWDTVFYVIVLTVGLIYAVTVLVYLFINLDWIILNARK